MKTQIVKEIETQILKKNFKNYKFDDNTYQE